MSDLIDVGGECAGDVERERPGCARDLQRFIHETTGLLVPSRRGEGRACGPLEYLWHAFDDGGADGRARDSVVWACRGGGKTLLGALATLADVVFNDGIQVRILAGSLQQASRMHAHLRTLFALPAFAPLVKGRITERRIELGNGSRVELLAQSETSVRGTRVHRLRCDEVELFDPDVWEAAQLVTRSERLKTGAVRGSIDALSTMHMPFGLMHRVVASCAAGKRTLFKWGIPEALEPCACDPGEREACPIAPECAMAPAKGGEDPGFYRIEDAKRSKGRVDQETWASEMLCLRPSRRQTVFPEFDEPTHVVREIPEELRASGTWCCGMDFGFRTSAILWAAHRPADDALYIVDERVGHNAMLRDHIEAIRASAWPMPRWMGVDPAGNQRSDQSGRSNIDLLRESGLSVKWRKLETRAGLELVRRRLRPASGAARLFIAARCVKLIEAMRSYHFDPDDQTRERPVKDGHDHIADALRYLVVCLDAGFETRVGGYA